MQAGATRLRDACTPLVPLLRELLKEIPNLPDYLQAKVEACVNELLEVRTQKMCLFLLGNLSHNNQGAR